MDNKLARNIWRAWLVPAPGLPIEMLALVCAMATAPRILAEEKPARTPPGSGEPYLFSVAFQTAPSANNRGRRLHIAHCSLLIVHSV